MTDPINPADYSYKLVNSKSGDEIDLPVYKASTGPNVIDITKLYAQTGHFTYDPGFTSTASCNSAITFIDGHEGILRHRGYDIGDLATKCSFEEVAYLMMNGELPNKEEYDKFFNDLTYHTMVHEQVHFFYRG